jgi:hypothetical protein
VRRCWEEIREVQARQPPRGGVGGGACVGEDLRAEADVRLPRQRQRGVAAPRVRLQRRHEGVAAWEKVLLQGTYASWVSLHLIWMEILDWILVSRLLDTVFWDSLEIYIQIIHIVSIKSCFTVAMMY